MSVLSVRGLVAISESVNLIEPGTQIQFLVVNVVVTVRLKGKGNRGMKYFGITLAFYGIGIAMGITCADSFEGNIVGLILSVFVVVCGLAVYVKAKRWL